MVAEGGTGVSVVVLTALPVEYQAVRRHLRHVRRVPVQGSEFEVGSLPGDSARIVLGQSEEGIVAAAVLAAEAIREFEPRALVFVGVAGALKNDLRIGDVVVATKVHAVHGAKQ